MWKRRIKWVIGFFALVLVSMALFATWAFQQSKKVPEFYERAIAQTPTENIEEISERLEASVQQLRDDAIEKGQWEASFTTDQINAWLVDQLPKRYPGLQRRGLQNPRVLIEDGKLIAATRFKNSRFDGVFSCDLSVQLTDEPNRLAITVHAIRIGTLKLPLSQFMNRIQREVTRQGFHLCWDTRDGETIALVELPAVYPGEVDIPILLESIALQGSQLDVSGQSGADTLLAYMPQGPVYQIASLAGSETLGFEDSTVNVQFEPSNSRGAVADAGR
ncbi:MAG: hypothetical protein AAF802_14970 [Planctomycetota bacterium]